MWSDHPCIFPKSTHIVTYHLLVPVLFPQRTRMQNILDPKFMSRWNHFRPFQKLPIPIYRIYRNWKGWLFKNIVFNGFFQLLKLQSNIKSTLISPENFGDSTPPPVVISTISLQRLCFFRHRRILWPAKPAGNVAVGAKFTCSQITRLRCGTWDHMGGIPPRPGDPGSHP